MAVFTTVASIVFLAFVGATAIGGTNWKADSEKLTAFVFEQKGESAASWSVKARRPGSTFSAIVPLPGPRKLFDKTLMNFIRSLFSLTQIR